MAAQFGSSESNVTEDTIAYMNLKKQNEEAEKFQYRAMKELRKIQSSPVYTKGYLKIKFPDMYVLQAAFSPSETAGFIYDYLRDVWKINNIVFG